jgi:hypothetical protein
MRTPQKCTASRRCWMSGAKSSIRQEASERCRLCGVRRDLHGAEHPHTRGEDCPGFEGQRGSH